MRKDILVQLFDKTSKNNLVMKNVSNVGNSMALRRIIQRENTLQDN